MRLRAEEEDEGRRWMKWEKDKEEGGGRWFIHDVFFKWKCHGFVVKVSFLIPGIIRFFSIQVFRIFPFLFDFFAEPALDSIAHTSRSTKSKIMPPRFPLMANLRASLETLREPKLGRNVTPFDGP